MVAVLLGIAVTQRRDLFLRKVSYAAAGAMLAVGQARFGTGGRKAPVNDFHMTQRIHQRIRIGIAAVGAGMNGAAAIGTGGRRHHRFIIVCLNRDNFLRNQNLLTDGAVLTFGQTGGRAAGFHCRVHNFRVGQFLDLVSFHMVAAAAVTLQNAFFRAGRFLFGCPVAHVMTQRAQGLQMILIAAVAAFVNQATVLAGRFCTQHRPVVLIIGAGIMLELRVWTAGAQLLPLCFHAGIINIRQADTAKGIGADRLHTCGDHNARQLFAIGKSVGADGLHGTAEHHQLQIFTPVETPVVDGDNTVRDYNARNFGAVVKSILANAGHAVFDADRFDGLPITIPRCRAAGIIIDLAGTGNDQSIIFAQPPRQIHTAGAADPAAAGAKMILIIGMAQRFQCDFFPVFAAQAITVFHTGGFAGRCYGCYPFTPVVACGNRFFLKEVAAGTFFALQTINRTLCRSHNEPAAHVVPQRAAGRHPVAFLAAGADFAGIAAFFASCGHIFGSPVILGICTGGVDIYLLGSVRIHCGPLCGRATKVNICQTIAAGKGKAANSGHGSRDVNTFQAGTIIERALSDGGHTLRDHHISQLHALIKRIVANTGQVGRECDRLDIGRVIAPRNRLGSAVVGHFSAAGNRQLTCIIQFPAEACAAGTGCDGNVAGSFTDGGYVFCRSKIQDTVRSRTPQCFFIIVVNIADAANGVTGRDTSGAARQKQSAVIADGTRVTVGHVHQVVASAKGDDVPHMGATLAAGDHITGNHIGGYLSAEGGQVAQILKGLGITFTNDLGFRIAVKNVHQLPRVDIGIEYIALCRGIVVIHQRADFIAVADQLTVVICGRISFDNVLRGGSGLYRLSGLGRVGCVGIAGAVIIRHIEPQGHLHQFFAYHVAGGTTAGLFIPIQLQRQVCQQRIDQQAQLCLFQRAAGKGSLCIHGAVVGLADGDGRGRALTVGNLSEDGHDCVIQNLCIAGQSLARRDAKGRNTVSVEQVGRIGLIQFIRFRVSFRGKDIFKNLQRFFCFFRGRNCFLRHRRLCGFSHRLGFRLRWRFRRCRSGICGAFRFRRRFFRCCDGLLCHRRFCVFNFLCVRMYRRHIAYQHGQHQNHAENSFQHKRLPFPNFSPFIIAYFYRIVYIN